MPSNPPVDFQAIAQGATGSTNKDYPYAIKATDLMKNFVFATLVMEEGVYEDVSGSQGHSQRRLKIPAVPGGGTYVLGAIDGEMQWIETEEC